MKTTLTKQRRFARALRRAASILAASAMKSPMAENSAYRFAADTGATAVVVVACGNTHAITPANWHITPKFGPFDHFQRWRFAT